MDFLDRIRRNNPQIDLTAKIWHPSLCNIYGNCVIGAYCNIGAFVEIGPGVVIGAHTRIAAHCFIPEGVTIEEHCFIGPGVIFTNDRYPPGGKEAWRPVLVRKTASIGAGSILLPGVEIGEGAMIGAGSVVTQNIPAGVRVAGVPSRRILRTCYQPELTRFEKERNNGGRAKLP